MDDLVYKAFISYSHQDERWARWLHRCLERYRPPKSAGLQGRLTPIFRDREELAASRDLSKTIQRALADSEHLIVICSPASAKSRWVTAEIEYFIGLGRDARVHCLIIDGSPGDLEQDCLPPPLRDREPLAADVRSGADGRRNALIKIAAGLLGVPLDVLRRRDIRRRQQRMALISTASFAGMLVAFALTFMAQEARDAARQETEKSRQITTFLVDVFKRADPAETRRRDMTAKELLEESASEISSQFESQPEVMIDLLSEVATIFESYAEFSRAEILFRQTADQALKTYGSSSLEYARSIRAVARMYLLQDRYKESIELQREALALEEDLLDSDDPALADTLSSLAGSLTFAGDFSPEVTELLERAEQLHQATDEPDNEDAIVIEFRLAGLYREQGRYEEAIVRYRSAIQRLDRIDARPDRRAMVLTELGSALEQADRTEESLASYDEAIATLSTLYGDEHANLANVWLFKSHLLLSMEDPAAAREAIDNVYRIAQRAHGPESDMMSFAMEARLRLNLLEGDADRAVVLGGDLVNRWTTSVGREHIDTATTMFLYAEALLATGEIDQAIEMAETALVTFRSHFPEDHVRVVGAEKLLADASRARE